MNVFEFLGLNANLRPKNKIVQLVKHLAEVTEKNIKFPMYAQTKKDGVFAMLVKYQGRAAMFGRTGMMLTNCEDVSARFNYVSDGVYISELCSDICSLEQLSGVVNPNRTKELDLAGRAVKDSLTPFFHDHLSIQEFVRGTSSANYLQRHSVCELEVGTLYMIPVYTVHNMFELEQFANHRIAYGEEGAVFKQVDVGYEAGHKGYRAMKIVRGVDYDLLCVGYEEGKGKYTGKVANLLFKWKGGETIKAMLGKGWTHAMAEEMLNILNYGKNIGLPEYTHKDSPIGAVFKVHALQESSKGKLRLPKVLEKRIDKDEADV